MPDDARNMNRDHWVRPPDRLVAADSAECVAGRLLECPYAPRKAFALVDSETDRLEGYVVVEGDGRWKVWDCQVNYDRITPACALLSVARSAPDLEALEVPVLPGSELAEQLRSCGMWETAGDALVQRTSLSTYWRDDHPAAQLLEQTSLWHLWIGASHH